MHRHLNDGLAPDRMLPGHTVLDPFQPVHERERTVQLMAQAIRVMHAVIWEAYLAAYKQRLKE
jgi:methionyl-tRNA synthetase